MALDESALAAELTQRHGVTTTARLAALGIGRRTVDTLKRRGRLRLVGQGCWSARAGPTASSIAWRSPAPSLVGSCASRQPASCGSCASRHGSPTSAWSSPRVDASIRYPDVRILRSCDLPECDIVRRADGIAVTTPPRTAFDAAWTLSNDDLESLIEHGIHRGVLHAGHALGARSPVRQHGRRAALGSTRCSPHRDPAHRPVESDYELRLERALRRRRFPRLVRSSGWRSPRAASSTLTSGSPKWASSSRSTTSRGMADGWRPTTTVNATSRSRRSATTSSGHRCRHRPPSRRHGRSAVDHLSTPSPEPGAHHRCSSLRRSLTGAEASTPYPRLAMPTAPTSTASAADRHGQRHRRPARRHVPRRPGDVDDRRHVAGRGAGQARLRHHRQRVRPRAARPRRVHAGVAAAAVHRVGRRSLRPAACRGDRLHAGDRRLAAAVPLRHDDPTSAVPIFGLAALFGTVRAFGVPAMRAIPPLIAAEGGAAAADRPVLGDVAVRHDRRPGVERVAVRHRPRRSLPRRGDRRRAGGDRHARRPLPPAAAAHARGADADAAPRPRGSALRPPPADPARGDLPRPVRRAVRRGRRAAAGDRRGPPARRQHRLRLVARRAGRRRRRSCRRCWPSGRCAAASVRCCSRRSPSSAR